jgi:hypothetical protein
LTCPLSPSTNADDLVASSIRGKDFEVLWNGSTPPPGFVTIFGEWEYGSDHYPDYAGRGPGLHSGSRMLRKAISRCPRMYGPDYATTPLRTFTLGMQNTSHSIFLSASRVGLASTRNRTGLARCRRFTEHQNFR